MSIEIVCDKGREEPIKWLEELSPFNLVIKQIAVGDYAIVHDGVIRVSIERKTWVDLANTIKDPKRKANHQKLLKLRDDTGCSILYIIEGPAFPSGSHTFGRVPYKSLLAHLHHNMLRDNCPYIQTKDIRHTAEMIIDLAKNLQTLSGKPRVPVADAVSAVDQTNTDDSAGPSTVGSSDTVHLDATSSAITRLKQREPLTDDVLRESVMLAMPGITRASLPTISRSYSIQTLVNEPVARELSELKYLSGIRIGEKRASSIDAGAKEHDTHVKMLFKIKGVTKETAEAILNKFTMQDITNGQVSVDNLAEVVKKTSTKIVNGEIRNTQYRVGPVVAKRVINILAKPA